MHILFIMSKNPKNGELLGKTFQGHIPYSQVEEDDNDDDDNHRHHHHHDLFYGLKYVVTTL